MKTKKLEEVRQMMIDRVPRAEITRRTGYDKNELVHFAQAWKIAAYGKPGPARETKEKK